MSEYVKIKRSKNLRFRLISLMYLIFIVLSMTQIPVAWLKITNPIRTYFSKVVLVPSNASYLQIQTEILKIENDFKQFIQYQNINTESPELNSYSKTDDYFLKQANGDKVFALLKELNKLAKTQSEKKIFNALFEQDLINGLQADKAKIWVNYKFKHTPANLVITQLAELQVRIGLLNESATPMQSELAEPKLSLLTKYASMRVGDEASFQVKGDTLQDVLMSRNQKPISDYKLIENGFVFKPTLAGTHLISVRGLSKSENVSIEVLPAAFPTKNALPFSICYKGVAYSQKIPFQQGQMTLTCSADPYAALQKGLIQFVPELEGWCTLLVKNTEGVLFHDSVFVKPLPEPIILVQNISNLTCSKKRLEQLNGLSLMAFHPSFKEGEAYAVLSFKVRSIGKEAKITEIQGNSYSPSKEDIAHLQYLAFYDIHYKIGSETKVKADPILIQIN
jgi:hypothetical protein